MILYRLIYTDNRDHFGYDLNNKSSLTEEMRTVPKQPGGDDHGKFRIRSACFDAINNAGRAPPRRATLFLLAPAGVFGRPVGAPLADQMQLMHIMTFSHKFLRPHQKKKNVYCGRYKFAFIINLFFLSNLFVHTQVNYLGSELNFIVLKCM